MKKEGYRRKTTFERKKNIGSHLGVPGSWVDRVVAPVSLLANLDRSSHRVDPLGRSRFNNYDQKN
jgi:hypothetical protein